MPRAPIDALMYNFQIKHVTELNRQKQGDIVIVGDIKTPTVLKCKAHFQCLIQRALVFSD